MIRRLTAAAAAAAAALAVTLAPTPAVAQALAGAHPCPPGQVGVVVHYQDPNGWITIDLPICVDPRVSHG